MKEQKKTDVSSHDLPLCCPTKKEILWSAHPRVYLSIERNGEAACPYCGTIFHLIDFEKYQSKAKKH